MIVEHSFRRCSLERSLVRVRDQSDEWLFGNSRGVRLNLVFEFGSGHIILGMSPRIPKEPPLSFTDGSLRMKEQLKQLTFNTSLW
ncbi:MAG: hypothetical protein ACRD5H_15835 [Nitrososphaerales archaeon]